MDKLGFSRFVGLPQKQSRSLSLALVVKWQGWKIKKTTSLPTMQKYDWDRVTSTEGYQRSSMNSGCKLVAQLRALRTSSYSQMTSSPGKHRIIHPTHSNWIIFTSWSRTIFFCYIAGFLCLWMTSVGGGEENKRSNHTRIQNATCCLYERDPSVKLVLAHGLYERDPSVKLVLAHGLYERDPSVKYLPYGLYERDPSVK